jgi:hypothetical protein
MTEKWTCTGASSLAMSDSDDVLWTSVRLCMFRLGTFPILFEFLMTTRKMANVNLISPKLWHCVPRVSSGLWNYWLQVWLMIRHWMAPSACLQCTLQACATTLHYTTDVWKDKDSYELLVKWTSIWAFPHTPLQQYSYFPLRSNGLTPQAVYVMMCVRICYIN